MEQEKYDLQEFERTVRGQLDDLRESPDVDLWAKIAQKQVIENRRLATRRWIFRGSGAVVLLLFWWMTTGEKETGSTMQTAEISQPILTENQSVLTNNLTENFSKNQNSAAANLPIELNFSSQKIEKPTAAATSKNDFSNDFGKISNPPISTQIVDFQEYRFLKTNTSPGKPSGAKDFLETPIFPKMEQDVLFQKAILPGVFENISQPQAAAATENLGKKSGENFTENTSVNRFAQFSNDSEIEISTAENLPSTKTKKVAAADFLPILKTEKLTIRQISNPSSVQILEEDKLTRPMKKSQFRIGLAQNEGKIVVKHSQNGFCSNIGLMLESHLAKNFWLLTGIEKSYGGYEIPIQNLSDDQKTASLNDFMFNPYSGKQARSISSSFEGISFPVGVSMYRRTKMKRFDWFARGLVRPVLVQNTDNFLASTNGNSNWIDNKNQVIFRPGWLGGQLGFQFRLVGRLRLEAAALAERTLGKLGLENTKYNNFGLRLGVKWGG